jgi:hypothetical protein
MTLTHSDVSELSQLMEGTIAGALIPELVRRGFQGGQRTMEGTRGCCLSSLSGSFVIPGEKEEE